MTKWGGSEDGDRLEELRDRLVMWWREVPREDRSVMVLLFVGVVLLRLVAIFR